MKIPVLAALLLICLVFFQETSAAPRHIHCAHCGGGCGGRRGPLGVSGRGGPPRGQFYNTGGMGIINANGSIGNGNGNIGGGANSRVNYGPGRK